MFLTTSSFAQNSGLLIETSLDIKIPFTITQFSTKQGLPQSQVLDIVNKETGDLIIATSNGIVEYNGSEFKPLITDKDSKNLLFSKLLWHEKTKTLFGNGNDGALHTILPKFNSHKASVAACINHDDIFYIDRNGSIFKASISSQNFKLVASTNIKNPKYLYYGENYFLIGTQTNIYRYNPFSKKNTTVCEGKYINLKKNWYNNSAYAYGESGVIKITDTLITPILEFKSGSDKIICQDMDFVNDHEYVIATTEGLYELFDDYVDCYTKKSALPSQVLQSVYFNKKEDCLFLGTMDKGLLKLQNKNCYSFCIDQGFKEMSSLNSIIRTEKGDVLVAEGSGNIYKISIDTVYPYVSYRNSYSSLAEIDGLIYAGTWGKGVLLLKDKTLVGTIESPLQLPDNNVHSCFKDSRGNIWIGTNKGISKGNEIKTIRPILKKEINEVVVSIYELKNGIICIGGSEGAFLIDKNDKIISHLNAEMGIEGREVRSFYEDSEGKLWIGTYNGGLYCYFKNKLICINKLKNAMLDKDAFCIAKDNLNYLYITSNHGLWCINEKDLSDFYYGKKDYLIPFHYEEESGILNTEFNGGFQNNFLKTKLNHFYFPSIQGLVIVAPEEAVSRDLKPSIDYVYVNDSLYTSTDPILSRNTFSIRFNFSSINFSSKYNVHYQYKLENGDSQADYWSIPQKNRTVDFKLLSPGKYTFRVRAVDASNRQNPTSTSYSFEIKPHIYETISFRVIAFLIFILLVFGFGIWRIRVFSKKAEEKEFYARRIAQIELKAIQAQLNPHFIFNCLNTIKFFILDSDLKKANKGLNHFSKLLRDTLDNSEKFTISLLDELTFITEYLELEKMRLQDQLEVVITNNIENTSIFLPTMLIQPHIENAIKHGISNLENRKGLLKINISKNNSYIRCEIIDNGIGRDAAVKINKMPFHKAFGIGLTKDKSEILKKIHNIEIVTTITDNYDTDGNPTGTMVVILIPMQDENRNS